MALAVQSTVSSTRDPDIMDIDIDMELDDTGLGMEEDLQLEVRTK